MGIAEILGLIADTVPSVTSILSALGVLKDTGTKSALSVVASILPAASQLMANFTTIKNQTETQYPEIWAGVQVHYQTASDLYDKLNAK